MLASYSGGRTWDKNCWYHSISRTGAQHTALTSSVATEDKSLLSIFLFMLYIFDANRFIPTKAQGPAFEIINRNRQVTFSSFSFLPFFLKLCVSVTF